MPKNLPFNMTRQVRTERANLDTHPVIFYIKTFQDLSFQEKKKRLYSPILSKTSLSKFMIIKKINAFYKSIQKKALI